MKINGITVSTPRTDSMRIARNAGNITVEDPLPASFAERLEFENDRACAEVVRLRTALNQIAHPATYQTEGQDPRQIATRALRIG